MRSSTTLLFLVAAMLLAMGCSPGESSTASPAGDDYVLVTLKRGSRAGDYTDEERQTIQTAHLANIQRLADEGSLVVAGPFGKVNHDPTQRGIFILDVTSLDQARALTNTDPSVIAGVLAMDLERLETEADLRAALRAELAAEAAAKREGRERPMSETIRAYVLVRAEDGARADPFIARVMPPGKVIVTGRVDGSKGFYIIDSAQPSEVRGWIGKLIDAPGPLTIDEWYGSALLGQASSP